MHTAPSGIVWSLLLGGRVTWPDVIAKEVLTPRLRLQAVLRWQTLHCLHGATVCNQATKALR